MFGKKKKEASEPQQQQYTGGPQPNNQPRTYAPPPAYKGKPLPGHAGYVTYKLRGRNAMTDIRFNYVRPDGKPDRGSGRYAE